MKKCVRFSLLEGGVGGSLSFVSLGPTYESRLINPMKVHDYFSLLHRGVGVSQITSRGERRAFGLLRSPHVHRGGGVTQTTTRGERRAFGLLRSPHVSLLTYQGERRPSAFLRRPVVPGKPSKSNLDINEVVFTP